MTSDTTRAGQFASNTFTSNNQMSVAACNAINVIGNPAAVTFSGNSGLRIPCTAHLLIEIGSTRQLHVRRVANDSGARWGLRVSD
jgi:hypothetical protein